MKYKQRYDEEWIVIYGDKQRFMCCDCGLVHDFEFDADKDGLLIMKATRNNRATGQARRHRKGLERKEK